MRRATWNGPGCLYVRGEYVLPGVQFDADSIDPDALAAYCERPVGAPRAKLVPAPVPVPPIVAAPIAPTPAPVEPHAVIPPVVPEPETEIEPVSKPAAHDKRKGKKR
jgi:hypothetical protein